MKQFLRLFIAAYAVSLLANQRLHAQAPSQLGASVPPPPQAAALAKFAQTPVSLYTGVPSISIPVYEVQVRGLTLPIRLDYHAGGVRVSELAGSVGLGWGLQAGGSISCTVLGKNDQTTLNQNSAGYTYPIPTTRKLNPDYYSNNGEYESLMQLLGAHRASDVEGQYHTPTDLQPDLFYYNFCGRSGKFFHQVADVVGRTIPFQPLRIIRSTAQQGYTITDEQGNVYRFTATEMSATTIFNHGRQVPREEATQFYNQVFYLTSIDTPYHERITLTYDTLTYDYRNRGNNTRYSVDAISQTSPNACPAKPETSSDSFTKVASLQIASIRSSRGDWVEFRYDDCARLDVHRARALHLIRVHQGPVTRDFTLGYDYGGGITNSCQVPATIQRDQPDSYRLFLQSVTESGKPPYQLKYYSKVGLPNRLSLAQDHWGFYTGVEPTTLLPAEPDKGFYLGANREPNPLTMLAGSLQALYYPTGGHTEFDFEPNTYYAPPGLLYQHHVVEPVAFYAGRGDDSSPGPSDLYQQSVAFVIPHNVDYSTVQAVYKTGCGQSSNTATPQFTVRLDGPGGYTRTFSWEPNQPSSGNSVLLNLAGGAYTASAQTYGDCSDNFFRLRWSQKDSTALPAANHLAGGLRIREVRDYPALTSDPPLRRRYQYTPLADTTRSSGRTLGQPTYSYSTTEYRYDPLNTDVVRGECHYTVQTSSSVLPLNGIQGGNVAYTQVQVYQDKAGEKGLSAHTFSWTEDIQPVEHGYPFTPPTSLDWQRGLPLQTVDYVYDNTRSAHYRPVHRTRTTYRHNYTPPSITVCESTLDKCENYVEPTQLNEVHAIGLNVVITKPEGWMIPPAGPQFKRLLPASFLIESFKHVSVWSYATQQDDYTYDAQDSSRYTLRQTFYRYDNPQHAQLSRTLTLNSAGDTLIAQRRYALDYDSLGGDADATGVQALIRQHMLTEVVEQQQWLQRGNQTWITGGHLVKYRQGWPYQQLTAELATPVQQAAFQSSAIARGVFHQDAHYRLKATAQRYDATGNVQQVQPDGGTPQVMLWDIYQQPVARVSNARFTQVASTSFEPGATGRWVYDTLSYHRQPGGRFGRYKYQVDGSWPVGRGGLPAGDYILVYWQQGSGSVDLKLYQGAEIGSAQLLATASGDWHQYRRQVRFTATGGLQVDATAGQVLFLDEVRLAPSGAQLISYTTDVLVGLTSQTDPTGRTTTYEYDALGRLLRTRDEQGRILSQQQYHYAGK